MQLKPTTGEPPKESGSGLSHSAIASDLPIGPGDLDRLGRWVPKKEMALLIEICDRAARDPDLTRPALLLCSAYAERVARMLDQDPFPSLTRKIADRLHQLRAENGL